MKIILPRELEEIVQHHLENGHYSSAVEVVRAALVLLEDQELEDQEHCDRREESDEEAAIEQHQTTTDQPDPQALLKWFEEVDRLGRSEHRETQPVKASKSEIEEIIVEKYRKQGLEL
jgi:putative addiction module CopG family antidote